MHPASHLAFHDGRCIPQCGLGLWQVDNDQVPDLIQTAFTLGYRALDTAAIYGNESGVGQALAQSSLPREEIFITTKLWNDRHGHSSARQAFQESLDRLGLDYVDLYLIHWPVPKTDRYVKAWEALIQLRDEGRARSIGVSNFNISHLQRLLDETGVLPVINQIELHPRFQQSTLRRFHEEHGILTQAWSPLGQGTLWDDPVLRSIAARHNRSVAQVILRWHTQLGHAVIPKTVHPERLRENLQYDTFQLNESDLAAIAALDDPAGRTGPDPELFRLPKA